MALPLSLLTMKTCPVLKYGFVKLTASALLGVIVMPLMMMSNLSASSDGMMPSQSVLTNSTFTESASAIFCAISTSKPIRLPCLSFISNGK